MDFTPVEFKEFSNKKLTSLQTIINISLLDLLSELDKINGRTIASKIDLKIVSMSSECMEVQAGKIIFVFNFDGKIISKSLKRINSSITIDLDYLKKHPLISHRTSYNLVSLLELLDCQLLNLFNFHNSFLLWEMINNNC